MTLGRGCKVSRNTTASGCCVVVVVVVIVVVADGAAAAVDVNDKDAIDDVAAVDAEAPPLVLSLLLLLLDMLFCYSLARQQLYCCGCGC